MLSPECESYVCSESGLVTLRPGCTWGGERNDSGRWGQIFRWVHMQKALILPSLGSTCPSGTRGEGTSLWNAQITYDKSSYVRIPFKVTHNTKHVAV